MYININRGQINIIIIFVIFHLVIFLYGLNKLKIESTQFMFLSQFINSDNYIITSLPIFITYRRFLHLQLAPLQFFPILI